MVQSADMEESPYYASYCHYKRARRKTIAGVTPQATIFAAFIAWMKRQPAAPSGTRRPIIFFPL